MYNWRYYDSDFFEKCQDFLEEYKELLQKNDVDTIRKTLPNSRTCVLERRTLWYELVKKVMEEWLEMGQTSRYYDRERLETIVMKDYPLLFLKRGDVVTCVEYLNTLLMDVRHILYLHEEVWDGHKDLGQKMREAMALETILLTRNEEKKFWHETVLKSREGEVLAFA